MLVSLTSAGGNRGWEVTGGKSRQVQLESGRFNFMPCQVSIEESTHVVIGAPVLIHLSKHD